MVNDRYFQNKKSGEIITVAYNMAHPYLKHDDKWLEISQCEFEIAEFAQIFAYRQAIVYVSKEVRKLAND